MEILKAKYFDPKYPIALKITIIWMVKQEYNQTYYKNHRLLWKL